VNDASKAAEWQTHQVEEAVAVLHGLVRAHAPARAGAEDLATASWRPDEHSADARLRRAEAKYRALVEQIPAVTFMAPLDGSTSELYVSPQISEMLGYSAREWIEDPVLWYRQLHPDDKERWQARFANTVNAGEPFRDNYRFLARDGRVVWVHGEAKVVTDDEGHPLLLQGVAFDITELKEAEEHLRRTNTDLASARDKALEASRAKSAFLANMSHELRTPLNAIIGYSALLRDEATDTGREDQIADLDKIHKAANHLLALIKDVLDLSKIEAGKMELFLENFDLSDVIQNVAATVATLVAQNGNQLEIRASGELGWMWTDLTKLRQVLFNVLGNASKFTHQGRIELQVARTRVDSSDWISFAIKDNGIGMTPALLERLFQDFTQGDESATRKYGGTGLGLAISRRICRLMGGEIFATSELNKGSTFFVRLPAIVKDVMADVAPGSSPVGLGL
jgi:PAS domain S-box-containing protein